MRICSTLSTCGLLIFNQPNIRELQEFMTQFMGQASAAAFCKELWRLCLDAQKSHMGVPQKILDEKKIELQQKKVLIQKFNVSRL